MRRGKGEGLCKGERKDVGVRVNKDGRGRGKGKGSMFGHVIGSYKKQHRMEQIRIKLQQEPLDQDATTKVEPTFKPTEVMARHKQPKAIHRNPPNKNHTCPHLPHHQHQHHHHHRIERERECEVVRESDRRRGAEIEEIDNSSRLSIHIEQFLIKTNEIMPQSIIFSKH
ncbi:hypothetical protein Cgig2_030530 [Carnegiea gigantea]|uniref:Uncharacterized protein n=1 Tax=Carnegiea gigantea TaxID=171969 RepID=A0A9Q1JGD0_9CARY|nr:hypothetical protein Cgig2_030530 [Carnegiea gigantea]